MKFLIAYVDFYQVLKILTAQVKGGNGIGRKKI